MESEQREGSVATQRVRRAMRVIANFAQSLFTGDKVLWVIVAIFAVTSILVVYSSTAKMGYDMSATKSTTSFMNQQIIILVGSLICMIIAHRINSRFYNVASYLIYGLAIVATIGAYFMGETNGAARWIPLGFFQLQPSEILKVATVLVMARQLAPRQSKMHEIRIVPSLAFWRWFSDPVQKKIWRTGTIPILSPVILSCAVIFPAHTSSAMLVAMTSFVMMIIARVRWQELLKLVGIAVLGMCLLNLLSLGRSETATGRVDTWIEYWTSDNREKMVMDLTDTERSQIAIYNGGLIGEGAGRSAIRVEMIHPESDYAYAFFVEEYGLILALVVLAMYLWIFFRSLEIFKRCGTSFPGLLALGLALMITLQALVHIMVVTNLAPETGQPLPLISRGGSSTLFTMIAFGMILSVSRQNDEKSHVKPRNESIYEN